jgi:hypothetical protein
VYDAGERAVLLLGGDGDSNEPSLWTLPPCDPNDPSFSSSPSEVSYRFAFDSLDEELDWLRTKYEMNRMWREYRDRVPLWRPRHGGQAGRIPFEGRQVDDLPDEPCGSLAANHVREDR